MRKEIDIFSSLEWHESLETTHCCRHNNEFCCCLHIKLALGDLGTHLSYKELINVVHLESCTIQATVLPLEFCRSWVIFGIIFATCRQSVYVEVFEFVYANYCVLIKCAEARCPTLEDIVSKDVELTVLGLVLEHVDAF